MDFTTPPNNPISNNKSDLRINLKIHEVIYGIGWLEIIITFFVGLSADPFIWWSVGFISGIILIGFSRVIFLLEEINRKSEK